MECISLILSLFFGFMIWFGWSLYGSRRSPTIKWKQLPKTPIAIMTAIISISSTSRIFAYRDIIGNIRYLPFSFPLRLSFNENWFYGGGEWLVGFITSEPGFSLQEPNFLQPKFPVSLILIISFTFFILNYAVTMLLLNYLSKRVVKDGI